MTRVGKFLVCVLVILLSCNAALACRWLKSRCCCVCNVCDCDCQVATCCDAVPLPPACGPATEGKDAVPTGKDAAPADEPSPTPAPVPTSPKGVEVDPFSEPESPAQGKSAGIAPMRTWSDATGQHEVRARLVEVRDGKACLRRADGQLILVSIWRLSLADRRFLGIAEPDSRLWTDHTGKYCIRARLVEIRSDAVRLQSDTGRGVVVSLERLSERDREYVLQCNSLADRALAQRLASLSVAGR